MRTAHMDLYDDAECVNAAVEKLTGFFSRRAGT